MLLPFVMESSASSKTSSLYKLISSEESPSKRMSILLHLPPTISLKFSTSLRTGLAGDKTIGKEDTGEITETTGGTEITGTIGTIGTTGIIDKTEIDPAETIGKEVREDNTEDRIEKEDKRETIEESKE
jgi:hypothetical protein